MIDIKTKNTVIFDFGDTIASTIPTYPERIRLAINSLGYRVSSSEFFEAYQLADYMIFHSYLRSGKLDAKIYRDTMFRIMAERLNIDENPSELKSKIIKELKGIDYRRELLENAADLLEKLKTMGFELSIISNNDGYTHEKCRELGIDKFFKEIVDSTNVGMVKPDRNIYRYTLEKLNTDPEKVVHIGDLYGADILGGRNSGLDVLWFNHRSGENYDELDIQQFESIEELIQKL